MAESAGPIAWRSPPKRTSASCTCPVSPPSKVWRISRMTGRVMIGAAAKCRARSWAVLDPTRRNRRTTCSGSGSAPVEPPGVGSVWGRIPRRSPGPHAPPAATIIAAQRFSGSRSRVMMGTTKASRSSVAESASSQVSRGLTGSDTSLGLGAAGYGDLRRTGVADPTRRARPKRLR